MVPGKIQPALNTCMKNIYRDGEYIVDAGPLGSPLGCPAVQSIPRQARITDTLRSKKAPRHICIV